MKAFTYFVAGYEAFPFDMLRHDNAWISSQEHLHPAIESLSDWGSEKRRIIKVTGVSLPTIARWNSFGWSIVDRSLKVINIEPRQSAIK